MARNICIIQGHPHGQVPHLCHAIADAYAEGAASADASVSQIDIGTLNLWLLRDPADFDSSPDAPILKAQSQIMAADHLVVIFPLWLGTMPAVVKAFFEQTFRHSFAIAQDQHGGFPKQNLRGKTARIVVTMGMPGFAYRWMFGAHGVRCLERSILGMSGVRPVRRTLVGGLGAMTPQKAEELLRQIRSLGHRMA
jgi:putative NADPH-quinone reductase